MRAVDAVLISHMHHDHLDPASLRLLGAEVPILVPCRAAAWLRRRDFNEVRELAAGETESVGGLPITAVEAHHDGRRAGGPRTQTMGFLVRGRHTVYFAGDTELFAGMSDISPGLDVALLPVGGWGRTLGPGHMNLSTGGSRRRTSAAPHSGPDPLGYLSRYRCRPPPSRPTARPATSLRQRGRRTWPLQWKSASWRQAMRRRSEKQTGASTGNHVQRGVLGPRRRAAGFESRFRLALSRDVMVRADSVASFSPAGSRGGPA